MLFSTATVLSTSIGPTTGRMVVTRSIQAKIAIIFIFIASTFYLPAYIPPLPIRAVIRNSAYLYILPRKDLKCDYHLVCCLCPLLPVFHVFFLLLCQRVYFNAHCRKLPPCNLPVDFIRNRINFVFQIFSIADYPFSHKCLICE